MMGKNFCAIALQTPF